jgi:transposase-like protein
MGKIIEVNERFIKDQLGEMVRGTVEEALNTMLDKEADQLCNAKRYEHTDARKDSRAGHYQRSLDTKAGRVTLKVPKLRQSKFETAIIERYQRRECSVEEALIEMYLAGVSVRRIEDVTEALWGTKVSPGTISELNKKAYGNIEKWRNRKLTGEYPFVYLDGISLKRSWGGEVRNVAVLVAIGVDEDGYRQILGIAEGEKEDKSGWKEFLRWLKKRGLKGCNLFVSDCCLGLVEALSEVYPKSRWQRCIVHFYRNVFGVVPSKLVPEVAAMLKAIHAQEDRKACIDKARSVAVKLRKMKLRKAADLVEDTIEETLTYTIFPRQYWRRIRTNNALERLMREIRRRTRVVGCFPDGKSALMLAAARLRHVAGTVWSTKKYLNMDLLKDIELDDKAAA